MARSESLSAVRWRALRSIDEVAAQARALALTDGLGQDFVYFMKLTQSQAYMMAYALDALAPVPAYVAAEAAAGGVPAVVAAQAVVDAAAVFNEGAGPAIEEARMRGKIAVRAATSALEILIALEAVTLDVRAPTEDSSP